MLHQRLFFLSCCLILLLLSACAGSGAATRSGARGFWKPNRYDRDGLAKGRWRTYYDDDAKRQPFTKGQYRHGRPVRTFRYYSPTGQLDHSERYGREGLCEVTYWCPDGKVARRGKAQWVTGGKGARFYWFGPWTSYAEDGQITSVQTYTDGTLTRAETYENSQLTQAENYQKNLRTRTETYHNGQLQRVENFENGRLVSTSTTL